MRDPITKLSIVTKEVCDPGVYKILGATQTISDAHQEIVDSHIKINVVYCATKCVRKTKGMMSSSETSILVVGDQALYLYQTANGDIKRTIPLRELTTMIVYPHSQLLFKTSNKEYDLLVQFESPAKDKQAPEIDFIINVIMVCADVLLNGKKYPIEQRQTNPLDDKEGHALKKPETHKDLVIPLTSLRVPIVNSQAQIENLIRPNAPSAQSNSVPVDFQKQLQDQDSKLLSPKAAEILKSRLFAGVQHNNDEEDESDKNQQANDNENNNESQEQEYVPSAAVSLQKNVQSQQQQQQQDSAADEPPMPLPPGGNASLVLPSPIYSPRVQARGILKKDVPLTEQEEEISKRNEELAKKLKQVEALQRSVELQQIQAIEMCDYIQKMTQTVKEVSGRSPSSSVNQNQEGTNDHSSGLNEDSSSAPPAKKSNSNNNNAAGAADLGNDASTVSANENNSNLPSSLRKVNPAPPSLLPDSFVKAVFGDNNTANQQQQQSRSHQQQNGQTTGTGIGYSSTGMNAFMVGGKNNNNNNNGGSSSEQQNDFMLRSSSPATASTLTAYYSGSSPSAYGNNNNNNKQKSAATSRDHSSGAAAADQQHQMTAAEISREQGIERKKQQMREEAAAEVKARIQRQQQEEANQSTTRGTSSSSSTLLSSTTTGLGTQELQEEVVRRVRAAEEMFSQRPSNEKAIFRRFHIEQRQKYLTDLQQAVATGTKPPPPAFGHFRFEGQSERPFPLAVDIFLTQQELLYLLRISQAEQQPIPTNNNNNNNSGEHNNNNYDAYSWNGANENVFAAQHNVYDAPVHHDMGGPLEPLAAHTSPEPLSMTPTPANNNNNNANNNRKNTTSQRWEDLTPEQQEESRRYWAAQQQQQPQQNFATYQQQQPRSANNNHASYPQQPVQPANNNNNINYHISPQPRQPISGGGIIPGVTSSSKIQQQQNGNNNNNNQTIRPSPGLSTYKNRYR